MLGETDTWVKGYLARGILGQTDTWPNGYLARRILGQTDIWPGGLGKTMLELPLCQTSNRPDGHQASGEMAIRSDGKQGHKSLRLSEQRAK
jgi:hypothetical protein